MAVAVLRHPLMPPSGVRVPERSHGHSCAQENPVRKYAKIDDNQPEIVKALREIGCSVQSLASVGGGCADLLVGYQGINVTI